MNKLCAGVLAAFLSSLLLSATARADDLDAWSTAKLIGVGVNIGNTLENTTTWETGWGNPRITKEFVQSLAKLGFKTVRVPVAWDTYARNGRIVEGKLARVGEVVDWITAAGMFCVVRRARRRIAERQESRDMRFLSCLPPCRNVGRQSR